MLIGAMFLLESKNETINQAPSLSLTNGFDISDSDQSTGFLLGLSYRR